LDLLPRWLRRPAGVYSGGATKGARSGGGRTMKLLAALLSLLAPIAYGQVGGQADLWLAGMPNGSSASCPPPFAANQPCDFAPAQSPFQSGITVVPGSTLTFSATGSITYTVGVPAVGPDGDSTVLITHFNGAENGISDVGRTPIGSLMGVFLGPN